MQHAARVYWALPMLPLIKRLARWAAALTLIVLGLVLSIPGIPGPGLLLILVGIFVLLPESRWLRKKYTALKRRYPRIFSPIETRRARARSARPADPRSRRSACPFRARRLGAVLPSPGV